MTIATNRRMTEEQQASKAAEEKAKLHEQAKLKKAMCECFATESGKFVLQWLMEQCGYQRPNVVADPSTGEGLNTTLYNEGRRALYLRLRKNLHRDILAQVEIGLDGGNDDGSELLT